nr:VOC family protein [Microbacterium bovistercoris]
MGEKLAADTAMGAVTLKVGDLDGMISYYTQAVPLRLLAHDGPTAVLGRRTTPVIVLEYAPELRHAAAGQAGLFHTAILFETEAALAAAIYSVAQRAPGTFTGSSDHLVSKAFYFTDPEGNGVELYWDRDRTQWSWTHGQVEMDTLFLDPNAFLRENLTEQAVDEPVIGDAKVGHVHLSVGDVETARAFYVDRLGFDATLDYHGSALFVSAGGYHHHMAMNVWNSRGAGRRQPTLGLGQVDIRVHGMDDLGALAERLRHYGVTIANDGQALTLEDPWANAVRVEAIR